RGAKLENSVARARGCCRCKLTLERDATYAGIRRANVDLNRICSVGVLSRICRINPQHFIGLPIHNGPEYRIILRVESEAVRANQPRITGSINADGEHEVRATGVSTNSAELVAGEAALILLRPEHWSTGR